jgi:hypothetical protein
MSLALKSGLQKETRKDNFFGVKILKLCTYSAVFCHESPINQSSVMAGGGTTLRKLPILSAFSIPVAWQLYVHYTKVLWRR